MLEPLIEEVRPAAKVLPRHLRRTISAITCQHGNCAKWRAVPAELGPWWMAAETLIRWSRPNVWERLLTLVQEQCVQLGMTFLDGTSVRAHQKAAGAAKKVALQHSETIVRHLAGLVAAMAPGRAVAFVLAPGQAHELPHVVALLDQLPGVPGWVVADQGYSSYSFREHTWALGARPAITPKQNEAPVACPDWIYTHRNQIERFWARLKEWRAVATRYEKTANSFMSVICMAAAVDWIKANRAQFAGASSSYLPNSTLEPDKSLLGKNGVM